MFVEDSSVCTVSVAQRFVAKAHLLATPSVPQLVGGIVGMSHLYQMSVSVGVQNLVAAALFVSKHRPPSSPRVAAELLSTPPATCHLDAGMNVSSKRIVSVLSIYPVNT